MPPKKKNNKKSDDWEADLGETAPAVGVAETNDEPAEADAEEEFPAGGLMAMLRKKQKKKNKGKQGDDAVDGEDRPTEDVSNLAEKAPVEASIDDEFALPDKKGKGKAQAKPAKAEEEEEEERGADGKVMTKAQKEKAKKEREKQRKKENVRYFINCTYLEHLLIWILGCEKEDS